MAKRNYIPDFIDMVGEVLTYVQKPRFIINAAIDLSGRASYFGETDFFKIDQSSFSALAALRFSF